MTARFLRDLRFGARLLRRSAGFTSIAVLSLGLGIGGATAVFSLVNAIVLRTLPVPDPQQLYQARSHVTGPRVRRPLFGADASSTRATKLSARGAGELFAASSVAGMQLQADGEAIGARGTVQLVSGDYFTALRQQAAGRAAARAVRQPHRRRASGRRHQRQLLAPAFRRRRRTPSAGRSPINGTDLHRHRRHAAALLRHDAGAARARRRGSRT